MSTIETLSKKYAVLCQQLGQIDYQLEIMNEDAKRIKAEIRKLNELANALTPAPATNVPITAEVSNEEAAKN